MVYLLEQICSWKKYQFQAKIEKFVKSADNCRKKIVKLTEIVCMQRIFGHMKFPF